MSIYIDPLTKCWPVKSGGWNWLQSCHMIADSASELIEFAKSIGLKEEWLQKRPSGKDQHFDLTQSKRKLAVEGGAVELDCRTFVEKLQALRDRGFGYE